MNSSNTTDPADTFSQAQFIEFINYNDESILMECVHYIVSSIQICDIHFIHEMIIPSIAKLLSKSTPINIVQYLLSIIPDICDVFYERFPDEAQNLLLSSVLPIIHAIALNSKNGTNALRPALLSKSSSNSNLRKNLTQKSTSNASSSNQKSNNTNSIFSSSSSFNNFDLNPQIVDVLSETWASLITMLDFNNFVIIEIPYIRMISSSPKKESRIVVLKVISFLVGFYDPESWFTPLFQIINQLATDNSGSVRALLPPLIVQLAHKLPINARFEFGGKTSPRNSPTKNQNESNNNSANQNQNENQIETNDNQKHDENETNNNIQNQTNNETSDSSSHQTENELNNDDKSQLHSDEINKIPKVPTSPRSPAFDLVRFCAIFTIFSRDSNTLVRKACAESLVSLCDVLDSSNRRVTIIPIADLLFSDQSEIVRSVMLRNLGPLISSLGTKLSSVSLVQKYCTTLMSKDVSVSFPAAFSFPAVTIALGHERFNELTIGFHSALNSKEFRVRRTLSFGLLSFAHILSKSELFEVVMGFLNDISSVAIGVMNNLNVIATMIDKKDRNGLIKCLENPAEKYDQWRMRLKVSEQLRYCSDIFISVDNEEEEKQEESKENDTEQKNTENVENENKDKKEEIKDTDEKVDGKNNDAAEKDSPQAVAEKNLEILKKSAEQLLLDPVSVVRKDAVLSFAYLMEKDNESDKKFILNLAKSDKYAEREIAASIFEFVDLEKINGIIHILVDILLNDKVANVRICVANAVMSIASVLPESNENYPLITEAIEKLKCDKDLDVRTAILN